MSRAMKDSHIDIVKDIPKVWGTQRLKYFCSITTGDGDTQDAEKEGAYPFYVRSPIVERSTRYTFDGEGILMAGDGAGAGRIFHHAFGKYAVHQRVYRLYDINGINSNYLFYYMRNLFPNEMDKGSAQSTVPSVRLPMLKDFRVCLPSNEEQDIIVRYLDSKCSAIDEAIERHKKIIEKLEEYRTKVVSHAVMHGLNPGVEEKRYPVIGLCPSNWKVSRLKFSASVVRGGSPRPIDNYITDKDGLNWIKIGDATGNGKYINSTKQQIVPEGLSKTRLVHPGTLLLTNSMSFGHPYILNIDGCIHDGWLAFSDYDGIEQNYLYYYLMSDSAMNQFVRTVEGSVVNNLNIEKVKNSLITIPPIAEQKEIVTYLDKQNAIIDDAIRTKEAIVTKLEEYRKSIIYNAVTGKIDCREAVK